MGLKIEVTPLGDPDGSSFTTQLNDNLDDLADEFDDVLYRDGSQSLLGDLNMNSNRIYNLPAPVDDNEPLRLVDAATLVGLPGTDGEDGVDAVNPSYTYVINTLTPGSSATLTPSGTYPNITLTFGIPRGDPGASGALGDADYGDIIVSGTGSVLTVDAGAITLAKMANLAQDTIIGRATAGAGVPEALTATQVKTVLALSNVDNTSDANKPVSSAQQTALDAKVSTADVTTQAWGDADTSIATTAFVDRLRDLPLIRTAAAPTAALTDRGGVVEATTSAALPANSVVAFPVGSLVIFYNDSAAAISLTITTDTLRLAGSASTGTRTIAARGYAYCRKRATTEWTVSGDVT